MPQPVIGSYLVLEVPEGEYKGTYQSSLYKMDVNSLYIDPPRSIPDNNEKPLPPGTKLIIRYKDKDDVFCKFETTVQQHLLINGYAAHQVNRPEAASIERNQRRDHARVPASVRVQFQKDEQRISCEMRDISGGGLSVYLTADQVLPVGSLQTVQFDINVRGSNYKIKAEVFVLRMTPYQADPSKRIYSVRFVRIRESDRQIIIQYVFQRQREIRDRQRK